eukprot:TRINITY_DN37295_c0_g1_i1.p1 TRINITY_DN37295_c0_g1~~TRINITY_DN37295_c0_g1_i1.p1  ORF type:complete len:195 (+),score=32.35 TRINITY_DN37295_c0_g1_i1:69-653(+)
MGESLCSQCLRALDSTGPPRWLVWLSLLLGGLLLLTQVVMDMSEKEACSPSGSAVICAARESLVSGFGWEAEPPTGAQAFDALASGPASGEPVAAGDSSTSGGACTGPPNTQLAGLRDTFVVVQQDSYGHTEEKMILEQVSGSSHLRLQFVFLSAARRPFTGLLQAAACSSSLPRRTLVDTATSSPRTFETRRK